MSTLIISDLHLGSEFCRHDRLLDVLRRMPGDAEIVLNGDVVHSGRKSFHEEHLDVIDVLKDLAKRRRVTWVAGNHDHVCPVNDIGNIQFKPEHVIDETIFVAHGHQFQQRFLMTYAGFFMLRLIYRLYIRLGARDMHAAYFAKKFPALYRIFRQEIASNAGRHAAMQGFSTVVCGHTHFVEEQLIRGIRYLNTGSWTENDFYAVFVDGETIELNRLE